MCGCKNKTVGANVANRNNLNFRVNNAVNPTVMRYNTQDFITKFYVGETIDNYIGKSTNINYGKRINNNSVLVHQNDYDEDKNNFSDTLEIVKEISPVKKKKVVKEEEISIIEEPIVIAEVIQLESEILPIVEETIIISDETTKEVENVI